MQTLRSLQTLEQAKTCPVSAADILDNHDFFIATLDWHDPDQECQVEAMLIRHERALALLSVSHT